jgi:hypothetical protein
MRIEDKEKPAYLLGYAYGIFVAVCWRGDAAKSQNLSSHYFVVLLDFARKEHQFVYLYHTAM